MIHRTERNDIEILHPPRKHRTILASKYPLVADALKQKAHGDVLSVILPQNLAELVIVVSSPSVCKLASLGKERL